MPTTTNKSDYMFEVPGDPGLKFISINASTLAAFCGRHRFKSQDDAFVEVLSRNKKLLKTVEGAIDEEDLLYKPLLQSLGTQPLAEETITQAAARILKQDDSMGVDARAFVESAPVASLEDIQALREKRPLMADLVEKSTSAIRCTQAHHTVTRTSVLDDKSKLLADKETKEAVRDVCSSTKLDTRSSAMLEERVRATWVRDRGTELESSAGTAIYDHCPEGCETREQVGGTLRIRIGDTAVWNFCRVDMAYVDNESGGVNRVFEIKNRRDRFFVPSYDLDQLCVYVLALAAPDGQLVERCQGQQRMSYEMSLDAARARFETAILPSLRDAVSRFSRLVMDPSTHEASRLWSMLRADTT